MINFTNLISKVSKVSKVSQQNCESRMGTCQADAQHSPSTYLPVDSVSIVSRQSDLAKYVASLLFLLCFGVGNVWGSVATFTGSDLNAAAGEKTVGSITLSTSNMTYSSGLYASGAGKTFTLTASGGATISQVLITMSGTSNRYTAANITNCTSCTRSNNVYTCTISPATSSVSCTNNGGGVTITQLDVTYSGGASTKRIYMKCGSTWCNDNPKFYAHSWGSSDSDVELTLADCETDVYYADIPSGNTSVVFTRQSPSSTGIAWSGDNFWNQSEDITISTNDKFTCTGWNNGKGTFSGSTYSAPTYTISFAANGGSGSMSNISSIACGADQAITANSYTKSGYQFAGWKANVDVKVGGVTKTAGTVLADGVTIQDISSNITLTAQWEEKSCPSDGTLYSLTVKSATYSVPGTTETNMVSDYATVSGGGAYIGNKNGSAGKAQVTTTGSGTVYFNGADGYLKLVLDCPIQTGDVLTFVNGSGSNQICFTTTNSRSTTYTTASNTYTFPAAFNDVSTIYVWRTSGSSTYLHDLTITRSSSCTAPTALAASSTTAKGTTFTVTDGANTNDYEFYVSTSSTAPTSGSSATYTSTSKTKAISDLQAGTTYYAWVRSKCDVSSKSEWTALTGNTFTTSTVSVTHTLTNVTKTSGAATAGGSDYTAVFAAVSGYSLPAPAITIDGNAAESGTDYTWTQGTGTVVIPANKITGNIVITIASAAAAPSSVAIGDNWLWFAGETMTLTATPTGGNGPVTYQWYKGGKADGNAIDGATNATFSKTCAFEDAGSYYCKVTCGGSQSTWGQNGDAYEVKVPRLYVKTGRNDGVKSDYGNVDFTRVDASTATASISLGSNWDYCFNIADGCGHYYGNAGTMQYNNYGPWVTNVNNQDCGLRTTNGATYVFTINYSNWTQLTTTVTFPSSNQAADKVIYFDNNDRQWSNLHYRIGRGDHTQAAALTLVPGTANLYKYTTVAYNNFAGWHIANNSGWTGSNTIYRTYTNGDEYSITYATAHEGGAVTQAAVTVTPTTSRGAGSDAGINDNCTFYNYEITTGMKTQNVSITAPSNGTITVSYTDVNNAAQSFTSGNADLAHTVIITPTVSPATGYQLSGLTVNGNAHTPGNTYIVTGTTVVAATFSLIDYTVTLNTNGGTINAGNVTSYNYGTGATLPTNVTKDGYTFDGWFDNAGLTGSAVTTISSSATGNKEFWAKWTEAVAPSGVCWDPATTPADKLANNTTTLTTLTSRFAAIDGVTSVTVDNPGTDTGQSAGSDDDSGYLKVKNATTTKIITIVTTAPTNITIGGKKYGSNTGSFYLVKSTDTETKLAECNTNAEDEATNLPAGTYYIYAKASTKSINFSKLCIELYECSTPAAPTAFSAGSITSTGATFSITDAADAASYDIYYSTSSDAPTPGTAATTTSDSKTKAVTGLTASTTYYAWVRSVCDADHKSAWVALSGSSFTTSAPAATYSVTHSLTNVTATSGATGAGAATEGVAYDAVFAANSGYVLPSTITVTIGGSPATVGTGYTWNASTGAFQVPAAQVTGAIVITIAGETAPATKDIYYGHVKITDGALVREIPSGATQFFTNIGGTVANNTEISLSSTPSTTGMYYNSNNLTDTELSKSSNWSTSSGSNRYIRGLKFANGTTYTLALGSKVASSIKFYGWCGSASKTMTVGGEEYVSSATKNTFGTNTFVKSGGFTGNVSITQDGDFYGILVITIQTATPCTTPVIPALSNQSLCEGTDIAEWDATQTAVLADGETVTYSWKKKGNDTELANTATFDLGSSATESQAGTYVVTVTVSKAGKASSSAYREVELSVTDGEEVMGITADKATVYPGNSVTLTATANTPATWQWYTCTSAEGAGAAIISGAESASYTIASAGAAGTYYYKAVATGSCGTAERVYTLTVSEASGGDCETEFWFAKAADKPEGATAATHISGTPSGSSSVSYTATIDGNNYTITGQTGQKTGNVTITVPEDYEGTLYVVVQGSSSRTITLSKGGVQVGQETPANSTWGTFTFSNLDAGTYTLVSSGNIGWGILALKLCSAVACSDPEVTASADNTTACVETSVTFTAANAHASATYQWQKLDGTWTNISGATASTYNIASVVAGDAGKYRVIASHDCNRTSNEVTLSVPSTPDFGSTVPASVSVMQTIALSINTVEATDAVKYRWYKSADDTWDAGDVEIGTNKELIKAYDSEAIGSPSYYIFCRAQNACGITTSTAIAVNVTAYVEEDCATRGNESDAAFSFENSGAGQGSYESTACWTMNSNSKILVYYPPTGKYFKTAKVTIASSSESKASYNWSTNGGTSYTAVRLDISTTLTERTIDLSAHGNVDAFQIGRNFNSTGESSGTLYVSKICFEYTEACTATTVTPSETSTSYEMGGVWSSPTFTLTAAAVAAGGTLTYSSSNEDIASVDDEGAVTFNGDAGSVTITASYAGDGTYCASEGSYTITVSCPGGAPKVVADGSTDMSGCNSSVTLHAKKQGGTAFEDGTYQWFRNGEEIDGATSSSYTATQAGTYTVERTNPSGCTTPSTNSAIVTSETTEPEVERLVPFQYYHVDKTYSEQMKMRHLFAVKNSGTLDGKHFKMYVSRNGGAATDVTSSNALVVWPNGDGHVDTVMVDLNKLSGKYSENDELVFTCKAIDCSGNVSDVYKNTITMRVIGATPTLALICSGSSKAGGTRKTGELTVGGDFLTGYNVADLCQQTGNTSFDANTEWGLYTDLKANYIVTPVNGYAVFNKLNYEPFDILLLTDYPKASKSDAAKDVLDDMAALCDYRPMLSFKTHMVAKSPSKWAAKGFTTSPVVTKAAGKLNLNIVCYAHPMFNSLKTGDDVYTDVGNTSAPLVYTMLTGEGYESSKGMQGFELAAAENFVTIGLTHYNANITKDSPETGDVSWTPGSEDRMLVTVAERQTNIEARFILFSLNCGAQSKLTDRGEQVVLACLEYLLDDDPLHVADCSFTFDNGASNEHDAAWYSEHCNTCTGTKGDGLWTTAANWGPDYRLLPGEFTSVRIKKPVEVNDEHAHVMEVRIIDEGSIDIPAGKALDVKSTIRRMDGTEIYPTDVNDIHIGSSASGNGTLIFNNDEGDTKAQVDLYSKGFIDVEGVKNYQYIGTPFNYANALYNYYGSWIYSWGTKKNGSLGWVVVKNGGPMTAWTGYCITQESPTYYETSGTLTATGTVDISVPADENMVVGNSWTAPIDINALTTDDLEGLVANIYFFNTGVDKEGTAGAAGSRYAGGTYVTIPVEAARYEGEDDHINSLQGFFVKNTGGSAGTLHLDYERHVRGTTRGTILGDALHTPRRASMEGEEPVVLKMKVSGENYDDKLLLLERENFSAGFDNGWDGDKWDGNESALYIYTTDNDGTENSVSAIPELEGTVIGFRAGEEDDAYTLSFEYLNSDEQLYLYDVENNTYTEIKTGVTYRFFTNDKEKHQRFIITRNAPSVATGFESTSDSSQKGRARKLLIEDKLFIMVDGMLYDATGKVVK